MIKQIESIGKLRNWFRRLLFNLIREEIELLIMERLAPAPKVKEGWTTLVDIPKSNKVLSWRPHPSLPNQLLVVYERPDGRKMKECVPHIDLKDQTMEEYLLSVPHARL